MNCLIFALNLHFKIDHGDLHSFLIQLYNAGWLNHQTDQVNQILTKLTKKEGALYRHNVLIATLPAGVDEAGRGSAASDIYVGCVMLNPAKPINGLRDSKKLSARNREALYDEIKEKAWCWSVVSASLEDIKALNVLGATLLAMKKSVEALSRQPDRVYIDGNHVPPDLPVPATAIIQGDNSIPAIMAASILAKVDRDRLMVQWHDQYPEYGFDQHKGYLTRQHMRMLEKYGPCPIHRVTYAPIKRLLR